MINIVLCDDDEKFCDDLQIQLKKKLVYINEIYKFYTYSSSMENYIMYNEHPTVFILDIDLKIENTDGYYIAKKIRQIRNYCDEIIFLTNKKFLSKKIIKFKIQPADFIEKTNYFMVDLLKELDECNVRLRAKEEDSDLGVLPIYEDKSLYNIRYKDIIYLKLLKESQNIIIKMHPECTKKEFIVTSTVNNMIKKLDNRFFQISRNVIINKDYLLNCKIDMREAELKYGYKFSGSENKMKELLKCLKK